MSCLWQVILLLFGMWNVLQNIKETIKVKQKLSDTVRICENVKVKIFKAHFCLFIICYASITGINEVTIFSVFFRSGGQSISWRSILFKNEFSNRLPI